MGGAESTPQVNTRASATSQGTISHVPVCYATCTILDRSATTTQKLARLNYQLFRLFWLTSRF